jgi:AcrR family transcriptional regulator
MSKGEATRQTILDHSVSLASTVGLDGLTIGRLAEELALSKSGLFAHFRSKETLQIQTLEHAGARFVDLVIRPSLATPRGESRIRAAFRLWMDWPRKSGLPGGCLFVAAAAELDDQPGAARDHLVAQQRQWLALLANVVRGAITEGHFRAEVEPEQFAQDLYGVMLACFLSQRLLADPDAGRRARTAFENLVLAARVPLT